MLDLRVSPWLTSFSFVILQEHNSSSKRNYRLINSPVHPWSLQFKKKFVQHNKNLLYNLLVRPTSSLSAKCRLLWICVNLFLLINFAANEGLKIQPDGHYSVNFGLFSSHICRQTSKNWTIFPLPLIILDKSISNRFRQNQLNHFIPEK